ncbi:MAG: hypothetical protein QXF15_03560 [Candidatus Aenigmatarchaeota archaeon]
MNISDLLKDPSKLEKKFEKALKENNKEIAHLLVPFIKEPYLIYRYARDIVRGKVNDELEEVIAQNPKYSYYYAKDILKNSFPKSEDVIAQDPDFSYWYAKEVIKGPFPRGEETITKESYSSYHYTKDVIKGPWEKGEDAIAQVPQYSYLYAKNILKDRFKKGEKVIIQNEKSLNQYIDFLKSIGKLDEFYEDYPELRK